MKRPQRTLAVVSTGALLLVFTVGRLPRPALVGTEGALLATFLVLVLWGRDFMIGRYYARRRKWERALEHFQRFESRLRTARWGRVLTPVLLSVYSFDGVAIVRNNIGMALAQLRDLDEAEHWLLSALERDPLYALPHANLGAIAGVRGQSDLAERHLQRAIDLGFSPAGAQRVLRRALGAANAGIGRVVR